MSTWKSQDWVRFSEPRAGQAFKEEFTRLGYRKPTNGLKKQSTTWLGWGHLHLPTYWFRKLLCSLILPLIFTKSSSVLSTCVFSRQSKFKEYCTQNSGRFKSAMNIYHVFHIEGFYRPKKIDVWCQTLSRSLHRGCGLGTRLLFFYSCHSYIAIYYLSRFVFFNENVNFGDTTCS